MTKMAKIHEDDSIWSKWETASAKAQNEYYRDWRAAHDSFHAGGSYADLETAVNAALAARQAADQAADATYRQEMAEARRHRTERGSA
jgi:hypothetical protein